MTGKQAYDPNYMKSGEFRSEGRAVRPKDAATLIIVRQDQKQSRVLMGKRAAVSQSSF